jgi:hypothetical protein
MRSLSWFLGAMAGACAGAPGLAQDVPSGTEQAPIVVEGRNPDLAISELIESLPPAPPNGHISRFEHAACPAALGLPPAQKDFVVRRMRAVGTAAGVPMGHADCRPNVLLLVTADKRRLIEQLERHYPTYLGELSSRQIARLAQSAEPAILWHLDGMTDVDGRQFDPPGGGAAVLRTTRAGSRLTDQVHMEYTGSILIVETRALPGLTTTQLADYAAMRTFTGADPSRLPNGGLPTILTLLNAPAGSEVPITLTSWDLAFLQSFYASDANVHAPSQRGQIQAGMRRALEPTEIGREHH